MVGVRPNIVTVGLTTGVDRDKAPSRRWRTIESRDGCKDAHDDEGVGKIANIYDTRSQSDARAVSFRPFRQSHLIRIGPE